MKTYNNTHATIESTNARNSFAIYRDILRLTDDGEALPQTRREWLHVTPSGRYVWQSDSQKADAIGCNDSCRIIENLQTYGSPYRFSYGKYLNQ